jgi:hypothetical protein
MRHVEDPGGERELGEVCQAEQDVPDPADHLVGQHAPDPELAVAGDGAQEDGHHDDAARSGIHADGVPSWVIA